MFGLSRWPQLQRVCDWVLADRPHGPNWAGAVAAIAMGATLMGRLDVLTMTKEAVRLAEEAHDTTATLHLRVGPAYARLPDGDLSILRALVIDATAGGEPYPAFAAVTALATALAYLGQRDELTAACRLGFQLAEDGGFSAEDSAAGPAQAVADHLAGDLDAPIRRLPTRRPAWELIARMWAEMASRVAVDGDDPAVAERAASMMGAEDAPGSSANHDLAKWGQLVLSGDLDGAADAASAADVASRTAFQRGHAVCLLATTLAHLERWDDTRAALQRLDDVLAPVTEPAPRMRASAAVTRARAALAAGRIATADDAAHEALRTASEAGLRLIHVDALEAVAAVALTADDPTKASRLVAAADAERRRRGYRGRLTSAIPASLSAQLAADHAAAWHEGANLSLEDATALAQRSRGPRGRPSFGFDAAHADRVARRRPRPPRPHQRRDRRRAPRHGADGQDPPQPHLRQARRPHRASWRRWPPAPLTTDGAPPSCRRETSGSPVRRMGMETPMKYMLLICTAGDEPVSDADRDRRAGHRRLGRGDGLPRDPPLGEMLAPTTDATTVRVRGGKTLLTTARSPRRRSRSAASTSSSAPTSTRPSTLRRSTRWRGPA